MMVGISLLPIALFQTIYMVVMAMIFAVIFGFPLGVILTISSKGHLRENGTLYKTLSIIVNIGRSFPFAILVVALFPLTNLIVGTSLGTNASIVPLAVAAIPFVAKLVEMSLLEVDRNVVEAAIVMGSTDYEIIRKVVVKEALPGVISGFTLAAVNLIGYSAMAGLVGGGGLGKVAIDYGFYRYNTFIMIATVVILILLVQGTQWLGDFIVLRIHQKRGKFVHEN
ncbi:MAG: D-methionine transport system permease protein MetI [Chlamydiae bacterium]|nr:D-methionine transport system permease protein MetI [Chlamydiota bacterium]